MKDEFDEMVEELNLKEDTYLGDSIKKAEPADVCSPLDLKYEEFEEDFEAKPAKYQVWVMGYNAEMNITDFDVFIDESSDANKAIESAQKFITEERYKTLTIPEDVYFLSVEVETVVEYEDHTENVGTLFQDGFRIKE